MIYQLNVFKVDKKDVDIDSCRIEIDLPIEPFIGMKINFLDKSKYLHKEMIVEEVICKLYENGERGVVLVCKENG